MFPHYFKNKPDKLGEIRNIFSAVQKTLADPDTILVNAQSVMEDLRPSDDLKRANCPGDQIERIFDYKEIPRVMPPFPVMWLEGKLFSIRCGVLVRRQTVEDTPDSLLGEFAAMAPVPVNASTFIFQELFLERAGAASLEASASCWLDAGGSALSVHNMMPPAFEGDDQERWIFNLQIVTCWVLHAFARMNCKNVELRPIKEGKMNRHPPNKVVPASVWHEIVIASVPKMRSTGQDIFSDHEKSDIRAHWIRGHYADYRKGRGLFGNPKLKALFWIPEHRQGNEALGQVIPEYTLQ